MIRFFFVCDISIAFMLRSVNKIKSMLNFEKKIVKHELIYYNNKDVERNKVNDKKNTT